MLPHDIESLGVTVHKRVEDAIEGADVIDVCAFSWNVRKKDCSRLRVNMHESLA